MGLDFISDKIDMHYAYQPSSSLIYDQEESQVMHMATYCLADTHYQLYLDWPYHQSNRFLEVNL